MPTQVSLLDGALASAGTLAIQTNGTTSAITISSAQVATFVNNPIMTGLTASRAVFTDGSKGLTSNAITGTGNVVMSASPTLTGTIDGAALTLSSSLTLSGGTANGVLYLNGSKVATSGSALVFDGTNLGVGIASPAGILHLKGADPIQYFEDSSGTTSYCSIQNANGVFDLQADNTAAVANSAIKFSVDSVEGMRLTSTGLGIGTSSPAYKLDVTGTSTTALSAAGFTNNSSANNTTKTIGVALRLSDTVGFVKEAAFVTAYPDQANVVGAGLSFATRTADATPNEKMRLDSSGNLGLGVTPSAWGSTFRAYQVGLGAAVYGRTGSQSQAGLGANYLNNGSAVVYIGNGYASRYEQDSGTHAWYTAASGTAGNAITFTQAMTLTASGVLQVGTTSASDNRIVAGGVSTYRGVEISTSTASARPTLTLVNFNTATYGSYIQDSSAGDLCFGRVNYDFGGHVERARIDSSGVFLVGDTSAITNVVGIQATTATSARWPIACKSVNRGLLVRQTDVNGGIAAYFEVNNGTNVGAINTTATATSYATSSDYRLKENIQPMQNALGVVAQLKPVTYTWKADGSEGQGFIAHELQAVVPDCVTGEKDAVDADGKPIYQGIDTSFLVATLTAAIQELKAEFDAYKATHP